MPVTVWGAFDAFRKNSVDLDPNQTSTARSSRDFLFEQLKKLNASNIGFPPLTGQYLNFGSFARRTKTRPINDVDMMAILRGGGTVALAQKSYDYRLQLTDTKSPLYDFRDAHGYVSSTRILNKIRDSLWSINQYGKAEIKKTMQAVTLNLKSYPWVFDIVPAVAMADLSGNTESYLVPNGRGDWICTDPRRDSKYVTDVSARHGGHFLPVTRLLKYWNHRTHKPRLPSYYFETLVLKTFHYATAISSYPGGVKYFFDNALSALLGSCPDPKGLGPNLDASIPYSTKDKVSTALQQASQYARYAEMYDGQGDSKNAIYWWGQIFGGAFPAYG